MFRIFVFIFICLFFLETGFCEVLKGDVDGKVKECISARAKHTESSIQDYYCPTGDTWRTTEKPITQETICGSILMQLKFKEIDKQAEQFMTSLQSSRNPNILSWTEEIRKKVDGVGTQGGFKSKYEAVCSIQTTWINCANTTEFFPEVSCKNFAKQKAEAWKNTGYILAAKGVAKSYQNDKDKFIDNTKTAYDKVLKKFQDYHQIFDTAVGKFTAYIINAVK